MSMPLGKPRAQLRCVARWAAPLLAMALLPSWCQAEPIVWFKLSQPPAVITDGPAAGHGYIDERVDAVLHDLPQFQVTITPIPPVRELQTMESGGAYCTSDLLKTPQREAFLRFTAPVGYVLPVGLVIRAEDKRLYDRYTDAKHMISLRQLTRDQRGVLGIGMHRSYGAPADAVIAQALAQNPGSLAPVSGDNNTATLFKMLAARHIDAVLALPVEQVYFARQTGSHQRYYSYSLVESPRLLPMLFSCTRHPATDHLFAALQVQAKSPALQNIAQLAYERWLPPYLLPLYRARLSELQNGN